MPTLHQNRPRRSTNGAEPSARRPPPSRFENVRLNIQENIQGLFTGRSSVGRTWTNSSQTPESPKTPRPVPTPQPVLGLGNMSSSRLVIPYLNRSASQSESRAHSRAASRAESHAPLPPPSPSFESTQTPDTPLSARPITPNSWQRIQQSNNIARPERTRHNTRRFVGVDSEEQRLAALAQEARRRRRHKSRRQETRWRGCTPKIKNRKIRNKILMCFVSGIFLTLVLTIYLALALSNRNERQEFHVLLIMIILITTIVFCHALIRLCMMLIHPPEDNTTPELPNMTGPHGYANPATPLQVTLARDEEAAGIHSEATKFPPPAYGLWRESVRVDPNRIFWQRNENRNPTERTEARPATANRPPSYISEEGIDYVIEAQPRSIAPTVDVPLPPHPSERGRAWQGPYAQMSFS